jgi:hypothetical protein
MKRSAFPLVKTYIVWCGCEQGEGAAGIAKGQGSVAAAVVSHYARDLDAEAFTVGTAALRNATALCLVSSGMTWTKAMREASSMQQ